MKALIFDTETSGLIDNHTMPIERQPEIIDFYGCVVDLATGKLKKDYDTLIKPSKPISEEITGITRITNDMLAKAPPFSKVAPEIKKLAAGVDAVIAHNLSFDMEMVDIEYERLGAKFDWPPRLICTVEQTVYMKGFRLSLTLLHQHLFGEGFPEAHRAKTDVQALTRCAVKLYNDGVI